MQNSRSTKAKLNIIVSLGCQLVTLLCGFIVPRLLIGAFGSEAYGATTSITQFLAYITLLEGGIGGVARAALYKPLAANDSLQISAVVGEIRRFFRVIAVIFAVYVLVLACAFRTISGVQTLDQWSTFFLVIVISISTFGQYFIGISNAVLLQAAQRVYVTNTISIGALVVNTILTVILVHLNCGLILVKFVSSVIFFLKPVAMWLYVRKNFALVPRKKSEQSVLRDKWNGLGQHIAYFLHSNTDIVVLTCFANLTSVAVYAVYNMVVSHMQSLVASCVSGMEALFGDMLAKQEHEKLRQTFVHYETMISVVAIVIFSSTAILIVPFIRIYTAGITDANYSAPVFAVLLVLSSVFYCLRMPYHSMVIAAGHFKQTQMAAYGEALLNIGLSVVMVHRFGLIGVVFATVLATAFRFGYYMIYLSGAIIRHKLSHALKRLMVNLAMFFFLALIGTRLMSQLTVTNYIQWAVLAVGVVLLVSLVVAAINLLLYKNEFAWMLGKLMHRRRR